MKSLLSTLSDRETEVYEQMVLGQSNVQISESLSITYHTVKFHVTNILTKLGVRNRTEAVAYGQSNSGDIDFIAVTNGGAWDERQIRAAAQRLVELGLVNRKEVNETVVNLLAVLGGKIV